MRFRTMMVVATMLTLTTACSERSERAEAADDETTEAVENEAMEASEAAEADEVGERDEADEMAGAGAVELPAELVAKAKVSVDAARRAALARVPGGTIRAGELEEEDGALIFSFDIAVDGQAGIEEVHVDALTGEVIKQEHEGAAEEAAEADEGGGR